MRNQYMYLYVHDEDIRRESLEKGRIKGQIEILLEFLEELGTVPKGLREIVKEQSDIEVLKQWIKLSSKVSSIEEFEETIKG